MMYEYKLWGANVVSDQQLDLEDDVIRRKLIEAKMQVDRTNNITTLFIIKDGKLQAHPEFPQEYRNFVIAEGSYSDADFYETEFNDPT